MSFISRSRVTLLASAQSLASPPRRRLQPLLSFCQLLTMIPTVNTKGGACKRVALAFLEPIRGKSKYTENVFNY
jgi:hypothetical protein